MIRHNNGKKGINLSWIKQANFGWDHNGQCCVSYFVCDLDLQLETIGRNVVAHSLLFSIT
jgi:hypothetical protein